MTNTIRFRLIYSWSMVTTQHIFKKLRKSYRAQGISMTKMTDMERPQNARNRTELITERYISQAEKNKATVKYFSPSVAFITEENARLANYCLQSPNLLINITS